MVNLLTDINICCVVSIDVVRSMKLIYDSQVFTEFLTILTKYSVDVTVTVDKSLNCSVYIFTYVYMFIYL